MGKGKIILHGIEYEVEGTSYDNGDGDKGVVFKFTSPNFLFQPLLPDNEQIFNTENLTYEPKHPNHKENEAGK